MYLGLLTEDVTRTLARFALLKHMVRPQAVCANAVAEMHSHAERFERNTYNGNAKAYVYATLLATGSRRMEACMRGEPWLTTGWTA